MAEDCIRLTIDDDRVQARIARLCAEVDAAARAYVATVERLRHDDLLAMAGGYRPGQVRR